MSENPHKPAKEPLDPTAEPVSTVPWRAVIAFVVISFVLAWLIVLPLWMSGDGLASPASGLVLILMMYTPAVAALITVFAFQRPRPAGVARYLGVWPLKPGTRTIAYSVLAIVLCLAIVVAGVFLATALGLVRLDLVGFSGYRQVMEDAGAELSTIPIQSYVVSALVSLPFAAVFNGLATIGEELGWRGWLLPSLRPLGTWPALLITGAIWGLWHSPIILLGYNFDQPNILGVIMMVIGCMFLGVIIGWFRLRSASVWPSVFAHGAFNAAASFLVVVVAAGEQPSPLALNPLGWVTWIVMAVVIGLLLLLKQFSRRRIGGSAWRATTPPARR